MFLHHPSLQIILPVTIISNMKRHRKVLLLRNVASCHVSLVVCRPFSWGVSVPHCWQGARFPAWLCGPATVFNIFSGPSWRISRSSLYFPLFFLLFLNFFLFIYFVFVFVSVGAALINCTLWGHLHVWRFSFNEKVITVWGNMYPWVPYQQ